MFNSCKSLRIQLETASGNVMINIGFVYFIQRYLRKYIDSVNGIVK